MIFTELTQIIIIIACIILSLMVFKFVTKILFKLIILSITIIIFYMGYQYFADRNIIDDISQLCTKKKDPIKCSCFVKPILNDLNSKFSKEEVQELKENTLKSNIEFTRAFKNVEGEIKDCFETLGETTLFEEILDDIKLKGLFTILDKDEEKSK